MVKRVIRKAGRKREIRTYATEKQVSEIFGVNQRTLQGHRQRGTGPPFRKWNRSVRYVVEEVEAWLDQNRFNSTSEYDLDQSEPDNDETEDDEESEDDDPGSLGGPGARPPPLGQESVCPDAGSTPSLRGPPGGARR